MTKAILALALFASSALAQIPLSVGFKVPSAAYVKDIEQARFLITHGGASEGKLSAAVTATATSIAVTGACPATGTAVYVDTEPLLVTAGAGTQSCTVTRNSSLPQSGTVAAVHAIGASVYELEYPSAYAMFVAQAVRPFIQQCIRSLATKSAVIGTNAGNAAAAEASITAALNSAAQ